MRYSGGVTGKAAEIRAVSAGPGRKKRKGRLLDAIENIKNMSTVFYC